MVTLKPISLTHLVGKPGVEKPLVETFMVGKYHVILNWNLQVYFSIDWSNTKYVHEIGCVLCLLVATKAQLGFGMPLFLPSFVIVVCSFFPDNSSCMHVWP